MTLNPYLFFNGNCKEAFETYEKCFGGKMEMMLTFADMPGDVPVPDGAKGGVAHAALDLGGVLLMGSDEPSGTYNVPRGVRISYTCKTPEQAHQVFDDLAKGGTVDMALQETFFSPCFGTLTDRFGIPWMVNTETQA